MLYSKYFSETATDINRLKITLAYLIYICLFLKSFSQKNYPGCQRAAGVRFLQDIAEPGATIPQRFRLGRNAPTVCSPMVPGWGDGNTSQWPTQTRQGNESGPESNQEHQSKNARDWARGRSVGRSHMSLISTSMAFWLPFLN